MTEHGTNQLVKALSERDGFSETARKVVHIAMGGVALLLAYLTWWQALMTILLGNVIVLIPMILNAHAGTKYGISFPVMCRASFGVRGANIPAMLRAVVLNFVAIELRESPAPT